MIWVDHCPELVASSIVFAVPFTRTNNLYIRCIVCITCACLKNGISAHYKSGQTRIRCTFPASASNTISLLEQGLGMIWDMLSYWLVYLVRYPHSPQLKIWGCRSRVIASSFPTWSCRPARALPDRQRFQYILCMYYNTCSSCVQFSNTFRASFCLPTWQQYHLFVADLLSTHPLNAQTAA